MKRSGMAIWIITAVLAILSAGTTLAHADLIDNWDFSGNISYSMGDVESNWVTTNRAEDVYWSDDNDNVEFRMAIDYAKDMQLTLEQWVFVSDSGTYTLAFDYVFDSAISHECDDFTVYVHLETEGTDVVKEIATNLNPGVVEGTAYVVSGEEHVTFTTAGGYVWLKFALERDSDPGSVDIGTVVQLDNVQFVVPVPAAALLGGIGLGCAGWRLRRRGGPEV